MSGERESEREREIERKRENKSRALREIKEEGGLYIGRKRKHLYTSETSFLNCFQFFFMIYQEITDIKQINIIKPASEF